MAVAVAASRGGSAGANNSLVQAHNGFNLVVGDLTMHEVAFVSNRGEQGPLLLQPGVHGVSNGSLRSCWHKVQRSSASLQVGAVFQ